MGCDKQWTLLPNAELAGVGHGVYCWAPPRRRGARRSVMSLQPSDPLPIPADTVRVARAAFPKGTALMRVRDELGSIYDDQRFTELFSGRGKPAEAPWRLALITVLQFAENLSDRQAADAARGRIDPTCGPAGRPRRAGSGCGRGSGELPRPPRRGRRGCEPWRGPPAAGLPAASRTSGRSWIMSSWASGPLAAPGVAVQA